MIDRLDLTEPVPVFPLPDVVFFPGTILPLHIFEPRYRVMVRDADSLGGLIAISLLRPGWESDYEGEPAIHSVGTVGRMEEIERLPDGRCQLQLVGLERVRFHELRTETPYRVAQLEPLPEADVDQLDPIVRGAKLELLASHGYLMREISGELHPGLVLDEHAPFVRAVNECCANLPVEPAVRQGLLEENDLLERAQRVARVSHEVLEHVLRLKARLTGNTRPLN